MVVSHGGGNTACSKVVRPEMVVTADGGGKEEGAGNVVVQWYVLGGDSPWVGDSPMGGRGPRGFPLGGPGLQGSLGVLDPRQGIRQSSLSIQTKMPIFGNYLTRFE